VYTKRRPATMSTDIKSVQQTVDFLSWLHGSDNYYIYICAQKGDKASGTEELRHIYYRDPAKIASSISWSTQVVPRFANVWFCTSKVAEKVLDKTGTAASGKGIKYARSIPAMWFDIDACKKFFDPRNQQIFVSGSEFLQDLRVQFPEVSAWVKSSEHGIQGYYKFDTPWIFDGDKDVFAEKLQPLLLDIMWFFGGDEQLTHASSLMRVPGTFNRKAIYPKPVEVTCEIFPDRVHTIKDLKDRFKPDFDACPRVVAYAIIKLAQEFWLDGQRNTAALALSGSIRQAGIDKRSCKRLFKELTKALHDDTDRASEIDSTYDHDFDTLKNVGSEYGECANLLNSILQFWFNLKVLYAKKRGIEWYPEEHDPTKGPDRSKGNRTFYTKDGCTWFKNSDGDEQLAANFVMQITQRVVKFDDKSVCALATITKQGGSSMRIELPAALHNSWSKFSTIKPLPSGIGFSVPALWTEYIIQIDQEAIDVPVAIETPYYGVLGAKEPTLFLPWQDRTDYIWAHDMEMFDTAEPGKLCKELTPKAIKDYLEGLAEHIPNYHDAKYLVPALGWFCGCPLREFFIRDPLLKHYPSLLITGQKGSGKSTPIAQFLGAHFGCRPPRSGANKTTTIFAIKRGLGANNICPYIMDEFRDDNEAKTDAVQGILRSLFDGYTSESGIASGNVRRDHLVSPMCIIGESPYEDAATTDRTVSIRVTPAWVRTLRTTNKEANVAAQTWLHNSALHGNLGTILVQYIESHIDGIPKLLHNAKRIVEESCTLDNERKIKGFIGVVAGILMLRRIFKSYDVVFPYSLDAILEAIYSADREVMEQKSADGSVMKQLFNVTDAAIIDGLRKHAPHRPYTYDISPTEPGTAYFQVDRWYDIVKAHTLNSHSASLRNRRSFIELLHEHFAAQNSVILEFDSQCFAKGSVKVDLNAIAEQYSIDVSAWNTMGHED